MAGKLRRQVLERDDVHRTATVTLRVVANRSPVRSGLITAVFTFVDGTGGLAGLHGQITEVIDLRAGTDTVTISYHFDP